MKKIFIVIVFLILSISSILAVPCGDVNSDSKINIIDALMTAQHYIGLTPPGYDPEAGDVNGDGSTNIIDALIIAQYYVGLINDLPGCSVIPVITPEPIKPNTVFAVNCGGNAYTSADGTEYTADKGYSGGSGYSHTAPVAGTTDDPLYQSERYGNFTYTFEVPNGYYLITLHFAETYHTTEGARIFDVLMEETEVISDLDIYAKSRGDSIYVTKNYITISDGEINIEFISNVENAKVNAIKVTLAGPSAAFNYSPNKPLIHQTVNFDASLSGNQGGTINAYSWDFGDGNSGSGRMTTHAYSNAGDYEVTLTVRDNKGYTGSLTKTLKIYTGDPIAEFTVTPQAPEPGTPVTIDASSSYDINGRIMSYLVDYGDGTTGSGEVTTHQYTEEGDYTITVTVTNNTGRTGSLSKTITVSSSVPLPDVVTSGEDNYWKTGTFTKVATGTPDITVLDTNEKQIFDGFGGTFNEKGWDALSVVSSEIPKAIKLLFDAKDGANFIFGRIPIGASDYAMNWYYLAETPGDYNMEHFSLDRDKEKLIPYIKAALDVKPDIRLWGSPWDVPDWMKNGSNMKSDARTLEAHALYLAKFVEEYGKEGMTIEAVQPQNEPGYAHVHWDQSVFINYFKTYLGPKFVERNVPAEIWCGTMSAPKDANIALAIANDPESMKYVTGFGLQWNHTETVPKLAPFGPVMQTEHRCGNYNFESPYWDKSRYSKSMPQNDHLYGEESWQLIRDWIKAGVNSYSAWNMVLDTVGLNLGSWHQNALLVVDRDAKKLIVTAAYYVFRHYSQYLVPGAIHIETSGTNDAVAFKNPDGTIVTQIYNSGSSRTMTVKVRGELYRLDVPGHGWATLRVKP